MSGRFFERLKIARDHRQQVVEIVSNATSELANAFHPLGMVECFLALGALQDRGEQARQ